MSSRRGAQGSWTTNASALSGRIAHSKVRKNFVLNRSTSSSVQRFTDLKHNDDRALTRRSLKRRRRVYIGGQISFLLQCMGQIFFQRLVVSSYFACF